MSKLPCRHIVILFLSVSALLLSGCGIRKQIEVKRYHNPTDSVRIVYSRKRLPKGLKRFGTITVENKGLTKACYCTFDACLTALRDAAGDAGADVVRIYFIQKPNKMAYIGLSSLIEGGITNCSAMVKGYLYIRKERLLLEQEQ